MLFRSKALDKLAAKNPIMILVKAWLDDFVEELASEKVAMLARQFKRDLTDEKYAEGYRQGIEDAGAYVGREIGQLMGK